MRDCSADCPAANLAASMGRELTRLPLWGLIWLSVSLSLFNYPDRKLLLSTKENCMRPKFQMLNFNIMETMHSSQAKQIAAKHRTHSGLLVTEHLIRPLWCLPQNLAAHPKPTA